MASEIEAAGDVQKLSINLSLPIKSSHPSTLRWGWDVLHSIDKPFAVGLTLSNADLPDISHYFSTVERAQHLTQLRLAIEDNGHDCEQILALLASPVVSSSGVRLWCCPQLSSLSIFTRQKSAPLDALMQMAIKRTKAAFAGESGLGTGGSVQLLKRVQVSALRPIDPTSTICRQLEDVLGEPCDCNWGGRHLGDDFCENALDFDEDDGDWFMSNGRIPDGL